LATILAFVGCNSGSPTAPNPDFNEHEWIETSRIVTGVRGVALSMPAHLRIVQGPGDELWMRGDRAVLPAIVTQVRNGILEIQLEAGAIPHPGRPTELELTTSTLESVELADDGMIRAAGVSAGRLTLELSGTGDLDFPDLDVSNLEVATAHGRGLVHASGVADRQTVTLRGVADYNARELDSAEAIVTLSGSGSATLRVSRRLSVTISGSGCVYYLGDPVIESTVTGSGRLIQLQD
jgi:hypothetical protein